MAKNNNTYAKVIARAWKDVRFKEKLLKNPKEALKEMGMDVPANFDVRVVEDKANSITFVLPNPPAKAKELTEQDLQKMAGGMGGSMLEICNDRPARGGLGVVGDSVKDNPRVMC
jgi:hypothetical protein